MISQEDAEKAVDYLRDNAVKAAKARAERLYMEQWLKTVLAEEMAEHAELPLAAQEREARKSHNFLKALAAYRIAVEEDEKMRFLAEAASAKLSAWQTAVKLESSVRV